MTMDQIRYALALGKEKNFTRASEKLFISQPALSLQISALEKELGLPLFYRERRGVSLTEFGKLFMEKASVIANDYHALWDAVRQYQGNANVPLNIWLGPRVYTTGLFDVIVSYFELHPEIDVNFSSEIRKNVLDDLLNGNLDIVFDRLPPDNVPVALDCFYISTLISEESCFILSLHDPKCNCKELSYSDMQKYPYVSGPKGSLLDLNMKQDCIDHNLSNTCAYRSNSMTDLMEMVHRGKGYLIGPKSFSDYYHVASVPKKEKCFSSLSFICLKHRSQEYLIKEFNDYLIDWTVKSLSAN